MTEIRRAVTGAVITKSSGVGPRQVAVNVVTFNAADRTGDIFANPAGARLDNFLRTRTVLFNHDPNMPVAACLSCSVQGNGMPAITQFPEPGISAKADEVYGMIQAKAINAVSIGLMPIRMEPLALGAWKILEFEMLEFSFVSVPAVPSALITARMLANRSQNAKTRAQRIREARILRTVVDLTGTQCFTEEEATRIAERLHAR